MQQPRGFHLSMESHFTESERHIKANTTPSLSTIKVKPSQVTKDCSDITLEKDCNTYSSPPISAWAIGDNSWRQLGSAQNPCSTFVPVEGAARWASISFGTTHTAGCSSNGDVYVWGDNSRGHLGTKKTRVTRPTKVAVQNDAQIKAVSCGHGFTVALTATGVLSWGDNEFGQLGQGDSSSHIIWRPTALRSLSDVRLSQVVCGAHHTLAMTAQSQVYSWGCNTDGQLGLGDTLHRPKPEVVEALWALSVVQLAAGEKHSMVLTASGHLFAWGCNLHGQLGIVVGNDSAMSPRSPSVHQINHRQVMAMVGMGIPRERAEIALEETGSVGVEVATEWLFSTAESTLKKLLKCRANNAPSRSFTNSEEESLCVCEPRRVPLKNVCFIACGGIHSFAINDDGVYSWGCGGSGRLGLGDTDNRYAPTRIECLDSKRITSVACGLAHSLFLSRNGAVLGCGCNSFGQLGPGTSTSTTQSSRSQSPSSSRPVFLSPVPVPIPRSWSTSSSNVSERDMAPAEDQVPRPVVAWGSKTNSRNVPDQDIAPRETQVSRAPVAGGSKTSNLNKLDQDITAGEDQRPRAPAAVSTKARHSLPERDIAPGGDQVARAPAAGGPKSGRHSLPAQDMPTVEARVPMALVAGSNCSALLMDKVETSTASMGGGAELLLKIKESVASARSIIMDSKGKAAVSSNHKSNTLNAHLQYIASSLELLTGSAAAISAAFGLRSGVGLDATGLHNLMASILEMFQDRASTSDKDDEAGEKEQSVLKTVVNLHKFNIAHAMMRSFTTLMDELTSHTKLLGAPERAQVLLAVCQHPLLVDLRFARSQIPRLVALLLAAPPAVHPLMVRWWAAYPAELLKNHVLGPLQSYVTNELGTSKKLSPSVMKSIKVLSWVEEANQISRALPPEAFYNELISAKMDVQDHYSAWRQVHDMPLHKHNSEEWPFSFCSFPFLLDARAKTNLLHIEARFQMEKTVATSRMEQQLYGRSRSRDGSEHPIVFSKPAALAHSSSAGKSGRPKSRLSLGSMFMGMLRGSRAREGHSKGRPESERRGPAHLPPPRECVVPGLHCDMCILRVRRSNLVQDALDEISRQVYRDLFKPLRVHFIGEEGIDAGGVKKEFFQMLVTELMSPDYGMLVYQPESRTYWFNACSLEDERQFKLVGLVLGLAIYNSVLLDFPLPLAAYKKLLGQHLGIQDLEDMQPTLGRSLRQLLEFEGPGSVEDTFCLTFSVEADYFGELRSIDLKPGGSDIVVTEENRHEYVDIMVDYLMNKSIDWQFQAFYQGFRILIDGPALSLFNAQELERLVIGDPNLDFDALIRAAKYEGGYTAGNQTVIWLWEVVNGLTLEHKKRFLKFFTGSDRSPIGGLGTLRCVVQRDGPDSSKLPTSHTCFNTLLLPEYSSRDRVARLLQLAINNAEGFGLQ